MWRSSHHDAEWDQEEYLLAAIFDRLGNKDSKPYPRPEDMRAKKRHDARALLMAARFAEKQKRRRNRHRTTN